MLYSSEHRPEGILRPRPKTPAQALPIIDYFAKVWRFRDPASISRRRRYITPHRFARVALTIHTGGTAIIMEHFGPEHFLALAERHQ